MSATLGRVIVTVALLGAGIGLYLLKEPTIGFLVIGAALGQLAPAALRAPKP